MAENGQTKVCPLCAETIQATAKICPHCRHWQYRWSFQNPRVGTTAWALSGLVLIVGLGIFYDRMFGPKEQFATYRDEISVVSSQWSQRKVESNLWITVVGTLTNHSDVGWKDVGVEAQFFDKSGKLIDAITVNADSWRGVTVLPHGETTFKIEGRASHPPEDYQTDKLTVRWAKDIDQWLP